MSNIDGNAAVLLESGIFDDEFYKTAYGLPTGVDPKTHFLKTGSGMGWSPGPLFDVQFYGQRYQLAGKSSLDLIVEFLQDSRGQLKDPHPLFSSQYYLSNNPDVSAAGVNPLWHYINFGALERRSPHPLFDADFYLKSYPDIAASGMNPLVHYIRNGHKEGRAPNPFFDPRFYLSKYPQVSGDPLVHYVCQDAQEGLLTHANFDGEFYLEQYPDVRSSGENPLAHFLNQGARELRFPTRRSYTAFEGVSADSVRAVFGVVEKAKRWDFLDQFWPCKNFPVFSGTREIIILVSDRATRTGTPMLSLAIAKELTERGYECLTLVQTGGELLDEFVEYSSCLDLTNFADDEEREECISLFLERLLKTGTGRQNLSVIINSAESLPTARMLKKFGLPTLLLVHEVADCYTPDYLQGIYDSADSLVFSSRFTKAAALDRVSISDSRVRVLPQGLLDGNFANIETAVARTMIRKELGLSHDAFIALGCGTVELRKGVDYFVNTARAMHLRYPAASNIHFVWIGEPMAHKTGSDFFWKWDIKQSGLEDHVHFIGSRKELTPYFCGADVFLMVSRMDALPCVVQNAMAAGLPIITFAGSGGTPELIEQGGGDVVTYGDTEGIARLVLEYSTDQAKLSRVGKAGREIIHDKYRLSDYVDSLVALVTSLRSGLSAVR